MTVAEPRKQRRTSTLSARAARGSLLVSFDDAYGETEEDDSIQFSHGDSRLSHQIHNEMVSLLSLEDDEDFNEGNISSDFKISLHNESKEEKKSEKRSIENAESRIKCMNVEIMKNHSQLMSMLQNLSQDALEVQKKLLNINIEISKLSERINKFEGMLSNVSNVSFSPSSSKKVATGPSGSKSSERKMARSRQRIFPFVEMLSKKR